MPEKNALEALPESQRKMVERAVKKQAEKMKALKARIAADHPQTEETLTKGDRAGEIELVGPDPETLEYNEVARKYSVEVVCPVSGIKHRRFTSDLHQAQVHPSIAVEFRKERKADAKATVNAILKAAKEGKIDLNQVLKAPAQQEEEVEA